MYFHWFAGGEWITWWLVLSAGVIAACVLIFIVPSVDAYDRPNWAIPSVFALVIAALVLPLAVGTATKSRERDHYAHAQLTQSYPLDKVTAFDSTQEKLTYTNGQQSCEGRVIKIKGRWTIIPETVECKS